MKFILAPLGSAGDVHPPIGLGEVLVRRGHEVVMITAENFRELTERCGMTYAELGTREEFLEAAQHPDLWHPRRAFPYIVNNMIRVLMPRQHRLIKEHYSPGRTVLIGSCLSFGARVAHDSLGIPLVTLHMQPSVIYSRYDTPVFPGPLVFQTGMLRGLRHGIFWLGEKLVIEPSAGKVVNEFRRELGLPPVRHMLQYWHSPQGIVCLFPDWYAPPQPDWPANVTLTHFPLWDERGMAEWPEGLADYLDAGEPPIAFTPGSAMMFGRKFFAAAADACRRTGRRGILLSRFEEHIPADLPDGVRHFSYVPFSELLPRCAATVHHGGIGSTAQGLAAGIPQLIMPMAHDQPDNVNRLQRLGVGDWLSPARFTGPNVARKLEKLLNSPKVRENCRQVAARFENRSGLEEAATAMEKFAARL